MAPSSSPSLLRISTPPRDEATRRDAPFRYRRQGGEEDRGVLRMLRQVPASDAQADGTPSFRVGDAGSQNPGVVLTLEHLRVPRPRPRG
jgi:hypothetical protein